MSSSKETFVLEGHVSVRAALVSGSRNIHEIILQRGKRSRATDALQKRAREKRVRMRHLERAEIDAIAEGQTHGGVVARVGKRKFEALADLGDGPSAGFVAMLAGVEDPYNFGQAIRSLHAAGAHGLVVPPRNWTSAASTVARASAGASEFLPMALAEDELAAVKHFRARNFNIVCTGLDATPLFEAELSKPIFLLIGGEKRGLSAAVLAQADTVLTIPYGRKFKQALDTTSATAVLAFEVMRQRGYAKKEGRRKKK